MPFVLVLYKAIVCPLFLYYKASKQSEASPPSAVNELTLSICIYV